MSKNKINRAKRQLTEWERIFANFKSDKRLLFRVYKELIQLNNKYSNNLIRKWAKDSNQDFSQKGMQIAMQIVICYIGCLCLLHIK